MIEKDVLKEVELDKQIVTQSLSNIVNSVNNQPNRIVVRLLLLRELTNKALDDICNDPLTKDFINLPNCQVACSMLLSNINLSPLIIRNSNGADLNE